MNNNNFKLNFFEESKNNYKDIDINYLSSSCINKIDEPDNFLHNLYYFNESQNMDSFAFEDLLMEEKMKNMQYNNNDNVFPVNDEISSYENQKNNFLCKKYYLNNDDEIIFKKNRNNLNKNIFNICNALNDKNESNTHNLTNETSSSNHNNSKITYSNIRSDSLLIKFKSFLGKSFINFINNKLKNLTKRKIKFFSFNYKKFTLNVTYSDNKKWLNEQVKNLLIYGDQPNQIKNEKALKSVYKKKEKEFDEVKYYLELSYKEIIEKFYLSNYYEDFKKDKKIIELNDNFIKIMGISLLEKNGFINFIVTRKANKEKSDCNDNNQIY